MSPPIVLLLTAFEDLRLTLAAPRTCIVSAIRIEALWSLNFLDITYASQRVVIVSALEPSVGVTLACIPLLTPLLRRASVRPERLSPVILNNPGRDIEGLAGNSKQPFESLTETSSGCRLQSDGSEQHTGLQSPSRPLSSPLSSRSLGSEERTGGPLFSRSDSSTFLLDR